MTGEDHRFQLQPVVGGQPSPTARKRNRRLTQVPFAPNQLATLADGKCSNAQFLVANFTVFPQEFITFILVSPMLNAELFLRTNFLLSLKPAELSIS